LEKAGKIYSQLSLIQEAKLGLERVASERLNSENLT
jgi:hypothetical protein